MRDLPGPGLEPVSPALAGGFLTTAPPGKPEGQFLSPVPFFLPKHHQLNNSIEFTLKSNLVLCLVLQVTQYRIHYSKHVRKYDQDIQIMTKYTRITIQVREKLTPEEKQLGQPHK